MPKASGKASGKQKTLANVGLYPLLPSANSSPRRASSVVWLPAGGRQGKALQVREFRDESGIVNEFALVYHLRQSFPLHYVVFKQTASHLPHEGNSEQLFSRAGGLSDDNGKMDPARLAVWTSIGVNYSTFKPAEADGQADSRALHAQVQQGRHRRSPASR